MIDKPTSHGPVDAGDAVMRVITYDADGGAPVALRRLAVVLEAEGCALHNVWLGAPVGEVEQLVFVTLRPIAAVPTIVLLPPPAPGTAAAPPCRHEWDTASVHGEPPQLRCRICDALSGTLLQLVGAR